MSKVKIFCVALVLVVLGFVLHFTTGLFGRFNFVTAYWDIWTGTERIIIYGEYFEGDSAKAVIAQEYGFKYERREDCTISSAFVNGVDAYNKIMEEAIRNRLGNDWNNFRLKCEKVAP